jgi:hypothetical protein
MWQCHEIFCYGFFHESSSPKFLKITLGSFRIFSKIHRDASINDTLANNGTISECLHLKGNLKNKISIG